MTEKEELQKLNEGLRAVQGTVDEIKAVLIGDEFNPDGIIPRLKNVEKKQKKLDNALYTLLGIITFGSYPFLKDFINEYLKSK